MPTYEYACDACNKGFELEQRISEQAVKDCILCGKSSARRMISGGAGFQLKGGGWYADGYGSSKPASTKSDSGDSGDSGKSSSSDSGSSDSGKSSSSDSGSSDSGKSSGSSSSNGSASSD